MNDQECLGEIAILEIVRGGSRMPMLRILGTAALLTIGGQLPVLEQAAIQEPDAYAFYHPGDDALNVGRPKPRYALLNQM
jgi:hypothetical protein